MTDTDDEISDAPRRVTTVATNTSRTPCNNTINLTSQTTEIPVAVVDLTESDSPVERVHLSKERAGSPTEVVDATETSKDEESSDLSEDSTVSPMNVVDLFELNSDVETSDLSKERLDYPVQVVDLTEETEDEEEAANTPPEVANIPAIVCRIDKEIELVRAEKSAQQFLNEHRARMAHGLSEFKYTEEVPGLCSPKYLHWLHWDCQEANARILSPDKYEDPDYETEEDEPPRKIPRHWPKTAPIKPGANRPKEYFHLYSRLPRNAPSAIPIKFLPQKNRCTSRRSARRRPHGLRSALPKIKRDDIDEIQVELFRPVSRSREQSPEMPMSPIIEPLDYDTEDDGLARNFVPQPRPLDQGICDGDITKIDLSDMNPSQDITFKFKSLVEKRLERERRLAQPEERGPIRRTMKPLTIRLWEHFL